MPAPIDERLRDHNRFTGDGLPNEPVGHPLPVGDPASGVYMPAKKDFRDALNFAETSAAASAAAAAEAFSAAGFANRRTRPLLVTFIALNPAVVGQLYSDGELWYRTIPVDDPLYGTNPIPDLPGIASVGALTTGHLGIVADGVTEVGAAIQAELDVRTELTFSPGQYKISQTLRPQSGTTITYQEGAEFICSLTAGNPLFANLVAGDTTTTAYNGRGDCRFIGPGKFRTVNGTSGRLQVYGFCHGAGFEIDGQGGAVVSGFDNRHAIEMNACRNWRVRGYRFADQVIPATDLNLYECIQYDQSSSGIYFPYAPGASDSTVCQDFEISGNTFENVGTAYGAHHAPALKHLRGHIFGNTIKDTWSSPERLRHLGAGCVVHSQTVIGTNGTSNGSARSIVWECTDGARIGENYQIVAGGGFRSSSNENCIITVKPENLNLTSVNRGTVFLDPDTQTAFVGAFGTGLTPPETQYIGGIGWIEADQDLQVNESVAFPFKTKLWGGGDPDILPEQIAASLELRKSGGLDTEQTCDFWLNVSTDGTTPNLQGVLKVDAKTGRMLLPFGVQGYAHPIYASAVLVAHTGTTSKTTIATIPIPAGALGPNGWLTVEFEVTTPDSNADNKIVTVEYGGAMIHETSADGLDSTRNYSQRITVHNANSEAAQYFRATGGANPFGTSISTGATTATVNSAAAQDLVLSFTVADATDTLNLRRLAVFTTYMP